MFLDGPLDSDGSLALIGAVIGITLVSSWLCLLLIVCAVLALLIGWSPRWVTQILMMLLPIPAGIAPVAVFGLPEFGSLANYGALWLTLTFLLGGLLHRSRKRKASS